MFKISETSELANRLVVFILKNSCETVASYSQPTLACARIFLATYLDSLRKRSQLSCMPDYFSRERALPSGKTRSLPRLGETRISCTVVVQRAKQSLV